MSLTPSPAPRSFVQRFYQAGGAGHKNRVPNLSPKELTLFKREYEGFPGGAVVENLPANAGHTGSSPGLGRSHMPWSK